jgi:phosphoserine phosphatase
MTSDARPRPFRTVIFDCDSTLTAIEGIDELARGHREEIERLTHQAMSGALKLEEVYARRLDLIRPTAAEVARVGALYIERMVPGAAETVLALREAGIHVRVLSGGLAPAVRVLAQHLTIPDADVAAVEIYFATDGSYAGFDTTTPLARSGGKREWVLGQGNRLAPPVLMVGDGATDMETRPVVAAFAAYTGVIARPDVVRQADVVIAGPSLTDLLPYVKRGA